MNSSSRPNFTYNPHYIVSPLFPQHDFFLQFHSKMLRIFPRGSFDSHAICQKERSTSKLVASLFTICRVRAIRSYSLIFANLAAWSPSRNYDLIVYRLETVASMPLIGSKHIPLPKQPRSKSIHCCPDHYNQYKFCQLPTI